MQLPPYLYHYTSIQGFLGIVESGRLWQTNIRYLNDASEQLIFYDALRRRIERDGQTDKLMGKTLLRLLDGDDARTGFLGVACFSEASDDLNQWRGYTQTHLGRTGIALRFSTSTLRRSADNQQCTLLRCAYGQEAADHQANAFMDSIQQCPPMPDNQFADYIESTYRSLPIWAASIKHDAFQGEREWRLVSKVFAFGAILLGPSDYGWETLKFRSGTNVPISYIDKFKVESEDGIPTMPL